jgi:dipeptide transport system ATP-binding protein
MSGEPIVRAENLARHYALSRGPFAAPLIVKAVDGVSFTLAAGETLAVVGESGCGKSTLARVVTMIEPPTSGSLVIDGVDVTHAGRAALKKLRSEVQIVFQDPYGSLNPRQKIGSILEEPLKINRSQMSPVKRRDAAMAMMARVGLRPEHYDRYPHMFSGGQRQRIAIARALLKNSPVLILDEATSELDTESERLVQKALANLMIGRTVIVIAHRLSTVRRADAITVIEGGMIRETGTHQDLIKKGGIYRRLHEMQFPDFSEPEPAGRRVPGDI